MNHSGESSTFPRSFAKPRTRPAFNSRDNQPSPSQFFYDHQSPSHLNTPPQADSDFIWPPHSPSPNELNSAQSFQQPLHQFFPEYVPDLHSPQPFPHSFYHPLLLQQSMLHWNPAFRQRIINAMESSRRQQTFQDQQQQQNMLNMMSISRPQMMPTQQNIDYRARSNSVSSSTSSKDPMLPALKKTKMCEHWKRSGNCTFGETCWYAHGESDIRKPGQDTENSLQNLLRQTEDNSRNVQQKPAYGQMLQGNYNGGKEENHGSEGVTASLSSQNVRAQCRMGKTNVNGLTLPSGNSNFSGFEEIPPLSPAQERWVSMSGGGVNGADARRKGGFFGIQSNQSRPGQQQQQSNLDILSSLSNGDDVSATSVANSGTTSRFMPYFQQQQQQQKQQEFEKANDAMDEIRSGGLLNDVFPQGRFNNKPAAQFGAAPFSRGNTFPSRSRPYIGGSVFGATGIERQMANLNLEQQHAAFGSTASMNGLGRGLASHQMGDSLGHSGGRRTSQSGVYGNNFDRLVVEEVLRRQQASENAQFEAMDNADKDYANYVSQQHVRGGFPQYLTSLTSPWHQQQHQPAHMHNAYEAAAQQVQQHLMRQEQLRSVAPFDYTNANSSVRDEIMRRYAQQQQQKMLDSGMPMHLVQQLVQNHIQQAMNKPMVAKPAEPLAPPPPMCERLLPQDTSFSIWMNQNSRENGQQRSPTQSTDHNANSTWNIFKTSLAVGEELASRKNSVAKKEDNISFEPMNSSSSVATSRDTTLFDLSVFSNPSADMEKNKKLENAVSRSNTPSDLFSVNTGLNFVADSRGNVFARREDETKGNIVGDKVLAPIGTKAPKIVGDNTAKSGVDLTKVISETSDKKKGLENYLQSSVCDTRCYFTASGGVCPFGEACQMDHDHSGSEKSYEEMLR